MLHQEREREREKERESFLVRYVERVLLWRDL